MYREYDSNRDKYPDFCSFFPKTIEGLKKAYPKPYLKKTYSEPSYPENVEVVVDPRIELVEIIYRLSNTTWYRNEVAPERLGVTPSQYEYLKDVDEYFAKYKNLEAVELAKQITRKGLAYDAIPIFALHLDHVSFKKYRDWDDLTKRGLTTEELDRFSEAVNEFAKKSDFWKFYKSHYQYYNRTVEYFKNENPQVGEFIKFEENFFGEKAKKWTIILQLTFARGNFASYFETDGGKEIYGILGICGIEDAIPKFCPVLAHEFAHSFVNPAVDKHYDTLFRKYQTLYEPVSEKMSKIAYSNWNTMLKETLIRAFEAYYLKQTFGEEEANKRIATEKELGFYFVDKIYDAYLDEYIPNRNKYRSFEDFLPEITKILGNLSNNKVF